MGNHYQDANRTYEHLVSIYLEYLNKLNESERNELLNALSAYNSQLFIPINKLKEIPDYKNKEYEEIVEYIFETPDFKVVRNIWNNFVKLKKNQDSLKKKYGFIELLDLRNFETYLKSLMSICDIIDKHVGKVVTDIDLNLYRGFNVEKGKNTNELSRGEYISTSIYKEAARGFAENEWYDDGNGHTKPADKYFTHIKLAAGSPFLIFPNPYKEDQFEVLIFKNTLHSEIVAEERTSGIYYDFITRNYICTPTYSQEKKEGQAVTK